VEGLAKGLTNALDYWQANFKERHFTLAAYSLYGYQRRSARHQERKARLYHHQNPLVFTGRSREATSLFRTKLVAGGAGGIKRAYGVHEMLPRYFYMWTGSAPHKAEELYTVAESEVEQIKVIILRGVESALAAASQEAQRERMSA
jgi:hypothetical protein